MCEQEDTREGVVREGVVEKYAVTVLGEISMPCSSSASEGCSRNDLEESKEEEEVKAAGSWIAAARGERRRRKTRRNYQVRRGKWVSKSFMSSGAGSVGGKDKLG